VRECGSGYYNPRPTPEAVGRLYEAYYTHAHTDAPDYAQLSLLGQAASHLGNGYRNYRFGMQERPASILGVLVAWLMPNYRALLDAGGRHLPKQPKGRLLDVGCGNGDFLQFAQRAGWEAIGVDPDPKAVEIARARGLTVHLGTLETLQEPPESLQGITMNHVIEHVHDPRATLTRCYRLLKPGGWLWLETPNLRRAGARPLRRELGRAGHPAPLGGVHRPRAAAPAAGGRLHARLSGCLTTRCASACLR
jgi:SAM-dependent methyltransferase